MDNDETQKWCPDEWTLPTLAASSEAKAAAGSGGHSFPEVTPGYVTRREQLTLRKRKAVADERDADVSEAKKGKGKRPKASNRKSRGRSSAASKASARGRSKGLKRLKQMASGSTLASESGPPSKDVAPRKKRSCKATMKDDAVRACEKPKAKARVKAKAKAKARATPAPETVGNKKGKGKGRSKATSVAEGIDGPSEKKEGKKGKSGGKGKVPKLSYEEPLTDPAAIKTHLMRMFSMCKMKGKNHTGPETFPQFESSAPVRMCPYKLKHHVGVKVNTYSPDGTFKLTQPHYLSMPSPCWCSLYFVGKQIVTWLSQFCCCIPVIESGSCIPGLIVSPYNTREILLCGVF